MRFTAPALFLLISCLGCIGDGSDQASTIVQVDTLPNGAVHRRYVERPEVPVWKLEEEVRLGAGEDETEIFGSIQGLELSAQGEILALDYQATAVRKYSWEGEYLATLVTEGAGPREMGRGNGLMYGPDDVLWVNDTGNGRILGIPVEGETMTLPRPVQSSSYLWRGGITRDGWVWDLSVRIPNGWEMSPGISEMRTFLYLKGTNLDQLTAGREEDSIRLGTYTNRLIVASGGSSIRPAPGPGPVTALDPTGHAWVGIEDDYRLTRVSLDGDTVLVLELEVEPTPLTTQERDSIIQGLRRAFARSAGVDVDWKKVPPAHHPLIENLTVDDRSRLWVLRWSHDETEAIYDVYSPEGELVATAEPGFRIHRDHPPVIRGDRFLAVVTDELEVQYVVGARISPD